MNIKNFAAIGFLHFLCTFILGLIISYISPGTLSLNSFFWLAVGVGVGRFCLELIKARFFPKVK